MNFEFDKLKDFFCEPEEENTKPTEALKPAAIINKTVASVPTTTVDSGLLEDFCSTLRKKLNKIPESATTEQFAIIADSLVEAIPDEGSRYRAAIKTLQKSQQISQLMLTSAFNGLLSVLNGEREKFKNVVEGQTNTEVVVREANVATINSQIEAKNKEIAELEKERDQLSIAILEQKAKINTTEVTFEGAISALSSEINDSLNKLKIYAPEVATAKVK